MQNIIPIICILFNLIHYNPSGAHHYHEYHIGDTTIKEGQDADAEFAIPNGFSKPHGKEEFKPVGSDRVKTNTTRYSIEKFDASGASLGTSALAEDSLVLERKRGGRPMRPHLVLDFVHSLGTRDKERELEERSKPAIEKASTTKGGFREGHDEVRYDRKNAPTPQELGEAINALPRDARREVEEARGHFTRKREQAKINLGSEGASLKGALKKGSGMSR